MPEVPLNFIAVLNGDILKIQRFLKDFVELAKRVPTYPYRVKDYPPSEEDKKRDQKTKIFEQKTLNWNGLKDRPMTPFRPYGSIWKAYTEAPRPRPV